MGKIKNLLRNKWVGFTLAALLYTLWFVVWTGNLWLVLGLPVIFDLYITKFFYRYVWSHNVKMCQRSKTYRTVYEWVNAIIFATVVATLVHLFIFQMYVIPTSSMERTLLIGDYLYVSKVAYGPQMPNTPLSFPFVHHTMPFSQTKKSFSEAIKWPYHRLKGLKPIRRNDVVVFNFPAGDTVLLENQNVTYYDTLRSFEESFGKEEGRKRLNEKYTVISRPVDKRENYIKRCVGLPGDSLEVRNGKVWVNGEPQEAIPGLQYNYVVQTSAPFTQYAIDNLGIREYSGYGSGYYMNLTDELAEKVRGLSNVISVNRYIYTPNDEVFPQWGTPRWSQDNYGPIWIPQKGATVQLTAENLPLYRRIIDAMDMGETNYLILLAADTYDVPYKGRDDETFSEGSDTVYKYFVCSVCPVKAPTLELKYSSEDSGFHSASTGHIALAPELGFLFPAFDDRAANIYNALFYSKNAAEFHQEVIDAVFRTEPPMSAEEQKNVFGTALGDTLQKECSYDVVQSVHEQLRERIAEHKESHDPEVLTLSIREVGDVLTNSGVSEEKAEAFQQECRRQYGEDVTLNPKNIIDSGKFQITTPEVKIAVAPEYSHMIEARVIDGRRYILIPADEGVEINGIGVNIPNPQRAEETEHEKP